MHIAIIGGGASGLLLFKKLVDLESPGFTIDLYERSTHWGAGMPYSEDGALNEHVTNVSAQEIPQLVTTVEEWIQSLDLATLQRFNIDPSRFNEYKVLPRLLFGKYLRAQFSLLEAIAKKKNISCQLFENTLVTDLSDDPSGNRVELMVASSKKIYDRVIVCTGHAWPQTHEHANTGYFDSPYPPLKLARQFNHPIALRGASLTAIDAIQTLAKQHGQFTSNDDGSLNFHLHPHCSSFRIVMHSLTGMLPAVRFHLEGSGLGIDSMLSKEEIEQNRKINDGFVSLDDVFEKKFKLKLKKRDPRFYEEIKHLSIEEFVEVMMARRERVDPFVMLRMEYDAANRSIRDHRSIYWKEILADLSFAMNNPAKHFSAEDMIRLKQVLMPLIAIVIAFIPQSSARELMALHDSGLLDLVVVDEQSKVEPRANGGIVYHYTDEYGKGHSDSYQTFIDCTGQRFLSYEEFPFRSLVAANTVSPAMLRFKDPSRGQDMMQEDPEKVFEDDCGEYFLRVPGVAIDDHFQVVNFQGKSNRRIYVMAVPLIGGYHPDFSGLDFCETASTTIVESLQAAFD